MAGDCCSDVLESGGADVVTDVLVRGIADDQLALPSLSNARRVASTGVSCHSGHRGILYSTHHNARWRAKIEGEGGVIHETLEPRNRVKLVVFTATPHDIVIYILHSCLLINDAYVILVLDQNGERYIHE